MPAGFRDHERAAAWPGFACGQCGQQFGELPEDPGTRYGVGVAAGADDLAVAGWYLGPAANGISMTTLSA
jgi:hypothetical protein